MRGYISRERARACNCLRAGERNGVVCILEMAAIASQLRNYKEPGKEQLTHLFFALPGADGKSLDETHANLESLDINAVLSLGAPGQEDSYVSVASVLLFSQSSRLTCGSISAGGKTLSTPAVPHFRLVGSQIHEVQHPAFCNSESREAQRSSWHLCAQLHPMARYQDRELACPSSARHVP